ncbi:MAG: thiolase family protein [Oscillochloris sp.]|nr:thiolase family protein [Oscillochloris sp.]
MGKIRRRVMMIGGAITAPMVPMEWTWRQLITEVFLKALDSAGVRVGDVDLVGCAYNDRSIVDSSIGPQVADALGIVPKPVVAVSSACAANAVTSYVGWNAIASGRCDIVVSLGFARSDNYDPMESMSPHGNYVDFDYMLGMTHINYNAVRDAYYREKYNVGIEDAGRWAYQCHWYAQRNPLAATYGKEPPTLEYLCSDTPDAERARMATNRGGVASCIVLIGEELARRYTDRPVWFDVAYAYRPPYIGNFFNYPAEGLRGYDLGEQPSLIVARNEAYALAEITPEEVNIAQVHDLSAYEGMMAIEGLGICPIGQGREYVASGGMALDSRCPVNTYGGGIAFGHGSVGSDFQAGLIENFWQLRGECGERQVPDATVAANSAYGTHHSLDAVGVLKRGW